MNRLLKIGDALSQLANVAFLPNVHQTTANESISGRAHRMGWARTEKLIDCLFSPFEKDHCKLSYEADIRRAVEYLNSKPQHERNNGDEL